MTWHDQADPFIGQKTYPSTMCLRCGDVAANTRGHLVHASLCDKGPTSRFLACRSCAVDNWKRLACRACGADLPPQATRIKRPRMVSP